MRFKFTIFFILLALFSCNFAQLNSFDELEKVKIELEKTLESPKSQEFFNFLKNQRQLELEKATADAEETPDNRVSPQETESPFERPLDEQDDQEAIDQSIERAQQRYARQGAEHYQNGEMKKAYHQYMQLLDENPCSQEAIEGLFNIAKKWQLKTSTRRKALHIYHRLLKCKPDEPTLLFNTARIWTWMNRIKKAKKILVHLVTIDPNDEDVVTFLFNVYVNQRDWQEASDLLKKYPRLKNYDELDAKLAFRRGKYKVSREKYKKILEQDSTNLEARRGLARSLAFLNKYKQSKKEYEVLVQKEPKSSQNWLEYMNVKSHTTPSLHGEGSYVKSKENDPDLERPVVRDFYTYGALNVQVPIVNFWRLNIKDIFFHQRESDIYLPMGPNYNVYIYGFNITSEIFFARNFRWDASFRFLGARGYNRGAFFPFITTRKYEPGTSLVYSTPLMFALLNGHVESFIIKNFFIDRSELLSTVRLQAIYIIRPNFYLSPELEADFEEIFYRDEINNYRNRLNLWARFNCFTKYLRIVYGFRQTNFKEPSPNYYSYKLQFRNTVGGVFSFTINSKFYFECFYRHWWKYSVDLNQPIGIFVFVDDVQRIQADKVSFLASYRYRDKFVLEAFGHLIYTTLTYRDFKAGGSLKWQF